MTEARSSGSRKALSFGVGLAMIFALAIPFVGTAVANHPGGSTLEVSAETAELDSGTNHTLTARLFQDTTETPVDAAVDQPVRIHFEFESGPAGTVKDDDTADFVTPGTHRTYQTDVSRTAPDMACTIAPGSDFCEVIFSSGGAGTNLVRAWIDHDQLSGTFDGDGTEGRYSGGPTVPGKTYTTDCRDAAAPGSKDADCDEAGLTAEPGAVAEPDGTDVVSVTWIAPVGNRCIDAEPEEDDNVSGSDHVIQAQVTNSAVMPNGAWQDDDDTFDCPGTAVSGAQVRIERTSGPAVTIDGVATSTATKATGGDGMVSFTVRCVDPNCTGTNDFNLKVVGATGGRGVAGDDVEKDWVAAGQATQFDVFPTMDTNQVGQTHTLTCRVLDAFDSGIAGQNCDFRVIDGPNDTRAPVAPGTENGYLGQCFTAANGMCSVSYSSNAQGEDEIRGWRDLNGNNTFDEPNDNLHRRIVFKDWVAIGFGPSQVLLDMENQPDDTTPDAVGQGGNCDTFDSTAFPNNVGRNHRVCAEAQNAFGNTTPSPITFRIVSGPGFFTDSDTSTANRGTEITIQHDADDARTWIRSLQGGNTVVQACLEGTTTCSSNGTKPWIALPARTIAASPATDTNPPGTTHEITATVLDRLGNPVAGQTVNWSRTGVGFIVSQETTTNAAGEARVVIRSDEEGTTSVTASIPVGERVECSKAANDPSGAPAGVCTVTVSKTWTEPEPDEIPRSEARSLCSAENAGTTRNIVGGGQVIVGTPGDDALTGTDGNDIICGLGGNDVIKGLAGNDELLGGGGNDVISGGPGRDLIRGGGGHDLVRGGTGHDNIRGGGGNDELFGGRGRDSLRGGRGHDTLNGQRGSDTMRGGRGNDLLRDVRGRRNFFNGGAGDDTCIGRANRGNTYRRCNTLRQV